MKTNQLRIGTVYRYTSPAEQVEVKYTGWSFCPSVGHGYGFKAYNEETGRYEYFNTLDRASVENMISKL